MQRKVARGNQDDRGGSIGPSWSGPPSLVLFRTRPTGLHIDVEIERFWCRAVFREFKNGETPLRDEAFMVCQVESLVRLQGCKKWDLVIIDEILSQCCSDHTNKANLGVNNMMFRTFMKMPTDGRPYGV